MLEIKLCSKMLKFMPQVLVLFSMKKLEELLIKYILQLLFHVAYHCLNFFAYISIKILYCMPYKRHDFY